MSWKMKLTFLFLFVIGSKNGITVGNDVNPLVISGLRGAFNDIFKENPDKFHPKDVEMVRQSDWWFKRFAAVYRTEDEALSKLIEVLIWRKEFAVQDLDDQYFPLELHQIGEQNIWLIKMVLN